MIMAVNLESMELVPNYFMGYGESVKYQGEFCILGSQMLIVKRNKIGMAEMSILSYPSQILRTSSYKVIHKYPDLPKTDIYLKKWCFPKLNSLVLLVERGKSSAQGS